jgi:hypothetical protein
MLRMIHAIKTLRYAGAACPEGLRVNSSLAARLFGSMLNVQGFGIRSSIFHQQINKSTNLQINFPLYLTKYYSLLRRKSRWFTFVFSADP